MMLKSKILIIFAVIFAAVGCFKDEAYNTEYRIKNYLQVASGDGFDDYEPLEGVIAYAFEGSLDDWGVNSYEDALAGVAYNFETSEQLTPFATATEDSTETNVVVMKLDKEDVMLLVVDTVNQIYATRNYTLGLNLNVTYITLLWRPWKGESYTEGSWYFDYSGAIIPETEELEVDS